MKRNTFPLTEEMIDLVARRFRLLSEPVRLKILQVLEPGELSVNAMTETLRGNQPNVSRHLSALFDGGLVHRRRDGNLIYYSIADPMVFELCDLVCKSTQERMRMQLNAMTPPPAHRPVKERMSSVT